jgi:hypothetical protein
MRCIFCKGQSDNATSIEHVIPHSLGNTQYVLPRGLVCDRCNNYIARKIEQPLLAHESFRNLRAWYRIPNKRGRHPSLYGVIPGVGVGVNFRLGDEGPELQLERGSDAATVKELFRNESDDVLTPIIFSRDMDPPQREMSRLLAKIALEVVALRMSPDPNYVERLIDDAHWDRIRRWVRFGDTFDKWPFHMRTIYPEETLMPHPTKDEWVQAGYIIDLLLTRRREHFLVLILYGYEFAFNIGGPSIKGYEEWLQENNGISPLIERLGLKLEIDGASARLIGQPSLKAGMDFDLARGVEGI